MDGVGAPEIIMRNRVNGTFLSQNVGKPISIIGSILKMNPSNNGFDIQTTDNHVVSVSCKEMISECLDGLVEVRGIAEGKNSVTCDYYILFPRELASTFDTEKDNEAVMIVNSIPNAFKA
ncbi:unnamed protein product [Bemisia tabaci]|uniref:Replication protein A3 n=1 Tax=Bemisia tabaci TaxID=7038 RepID=A0A9P0A7P6_BEMTA|nr:PREDICTED: uncharacterized protein LOC109039493 [Bemisia tabaci]CAH0385113.1 unnamed protein product [Bemisia tabaci]